MGRNVFLMLRHRLNSANAIAITAVMALSAEQFVMGDWKSIQDWAQCAEMVGPGIIFELRNAEGQSLYSPSVSSVPATPFGWKSAPKEFRAIRQPPPEHSSPMPLPNPDDGGPAK